jgi:hypothetical protein
MLQQFHHSGVSNGAAEDSLVAPSGSLSITKNNDPEKFSTPHDYFGITGKKRVLRYRRHLQYDFIRI